MEFVPVERVHELEAQLRNEIDRANRYRYYLGVAGWYSPDPGPARLESSVTDVASPEEFWAHVRVLVDNPDDVSALDIGSGVRPFSLRRYQIHVCLEPFEPYVEELARRFRRQSDLIVIKGAAPDGLDIFPDGAFDSVILTDVIEHLTREEGRATIDHALRIARNHVHVQAPDGFMPQHIGALDDDGWGYVGNELQTHISAWTADDFAGWRVVRCANYQEKDGETYGAVWATYAHPRAQGRNHASIRFADPIDPSEAWSAWLDALEQQLTFCQVTIHPELAPWSFRTRPGPRLPTTMTGVDLDALDLAPAREHDLGHGCGVCGSAPPSRTVVVLQALKDLDKAVERAAAKRVLVISLEPAPGGAREAVHGDSRYYLTSMSEGSDMPYAIEWLLKSEDEPRSS